MALLFLIGFIVCMGVFLQDKLSQRQGSIAEAVYDLLDQDADFARSYKIAYDSSASFSNDTYMDKTDSAINSFRRQFVSEMCEKYSPANLKKARKYLKSDKHNDVSQYLPGLPEILGYVSAEVISDFQNNLEKAATQSPEEKKARRRRRR